MLTRSQWPRIASNYLPPSKKNLAVGKLSVIPILVEKCRNAKFEAYLTSFCCNFGAKLIRAEKNCNFCLAYPRRRWTHFISSHFCRFVRTALSPGELSPNSITPTFTEIFPQGKSWTQIMKVADTNHLEMSRFLRQSPWQTRLCRSNGI